VCVCVGLDCFAAVASKDITTSNFNKRFAVTLESYARFLHIFGPLRPTILSDVRRLCQPLPSSSLGGGG
jgi:hypothetical protein